jgi:hypothetical protein
LLLFVTPLCRATDIYFAQTSAGGNTGANCSNARAVSTASGTDWAAGNTLHLCGTITATAGSAGFVAQGSGTSGSPIIVKFEAGAVLQAPYFGGGYACYTLATCNAGIEIYGYNYIIVDGGTDGIIRNTANGTDLANQQTSAGVALYGNNLKVRNLTVRNIYINDPTNNDTAGAHTVDVIVVAGAQNVAICNNTFNNARTGVASNGVGSATPVYPSPSCSSNTFTAGQNYWGNTLYDHTWMFQTSPPVASTFNIFNNNMSGTFNWLEPNYNFHPDGIITWGYPQSALYAYNNYFHDADFGTAPIYCTGGNAGSGSSCYIFNNLFVQQPVYANLKGHGVMLNLSLGATYNIGPFYLYNNTFINYSIPLDPWGDGVVGVTVENNLMSEGTTSANYFYDKDYGSNSLTTVITASDYNSFYGGRASGSFNSIGSDTWCWPQNGGPPSGCTGNTPWVHTGFDTHSVSANPLLTASNTLGAGSPDIKAGTNLTSLCGRIPPLCYDAAGVARPATGAWDIGAYQHLQPDPPTALRAIVK